MMDYKDLQAENDRLRRLTRMAKLGWWEADFKSKTYVCSDFVADLLGLEGNTIGFYEFGDLIREDFRFRIGKDFMAIAELEVYEQKFPIQSKYGIVWVNSKLSSKEVTPDGNVIALGYLQCVDDPERTDQGEAMVQRMNNLLYQQNSISRSLLTLLNTENMTEIISKILKDILIQYNAGRTYIFEFDFDSACQNCINEVTRKDVSSEKDMLQKLPISTVAWWSSQLLARKPIILYSLDDMPSEEAYADRLMLEAQGVKSIMAVPLIYKEDVWGYIGVDIVDQHRSWKNEDYHWLASMANIISICMGLRHSEQEAEEERRYLKRLNKHMPVGYLRMKMLYDENEKAVDYEFLDINDAALDILETKITDYLGKTAGEIGLDLHINIPSLMEVLNTDSFKEVNYKLNNRQGEKYCHCIIYSPQKDEVVIMFSDMTETFLAHDALDRSERILRNIYKNLPAGIELYDKDGYLLDMNDKDVELFGLSGKEAVLGVNLFQNPNIPADMKEKLKAKEDLDFTLNYDFSRINSNGYYESSKKGVINLVTKVTSLYDSYNNFSNYLFINIDTTETTNAYTKIQEFEEFFRLVGDYAKVGYAHFNALTRDGYALSSWYSNVGEEEGTPLPQIIGVHSHFHPEDRAVMIDFLGKVVRGEATSLRREMRILRPNERITWTSVNILVRDYRPDDGIIETVCINYDITNLKETEEQLIIAKNKAETMDKLKSAFLANMSHEIRTPLNAIVGFSNLLVDTEDCEERKQYIGIVQENNELLLQLISDILDLSKIEAGTFEFVKSNVNVKQLCIEITRSMSMKTAGTPVRILFDDSLPEYIIFSDKNRLLQVITNFINNALKFTPSGSITLGYTLQNGELRFYVSDTGVGIPEEKLKTIFDRFVKLNAFVHGTGLGLSICKSIVEQMNGRIGVESRLGEGSCFWFTHPYEERLKEETAATQEVNLLRSPETHATEKPVVLIAEDTDSNYLLVSTILKKEYTLLRAFNGKDAVGMFRLHRPAIILMDVKMPEMDGIEATQIIRREDAQIPIIAVTAFAFDQDRQRTHEAGCNDYISKPVSGPEMKAMVKKWLDK